MYCFTSHFSWWSLFFRVKRQVTLLALAFTNKIIPLGKPTWFLWRQRHDSNNQSLFTRHVFIDYDVTDVATEAILKLVEQLSIPAYSIMPYTSFFWNPSKQGTNHSFRDFPLQSKNDQGCCISVSVRIQISSMGDILDGFPAWSLLSRRQFLLGQLQFLVFSPFV